MTWNNEAGLDPDSLFLRDRAADKVGNDFTQLASKLEKLKKNFDSYKADMGMPGCDEGDSWNDKVQEAAGHVSDTLSAFIRRANEYAQRAHATQKACQNTDENNAHSFEPVDRSASHPPLVPGT
ncbi:hypothetical protein [Mycobacteroides abscessus]|uniref:hypothetical protein n=1 Tax=Mycobacteroides abscessus TaxID=36809 RepID=UPI0009A6BD1D|nr:hypothetical protein [Mycobacteroides abscessus]SKP66173.1 Uncharacterised protein [Mycobacteroides abscessus subsp. massiliense]